MLFIVSIQDKVHQFNLTITPCPPGHTLRRNDLEDLYSCGCNDEKNIDIVNCLPGTRKLIIKVCKTYSLLTK